MQRHFSYLHLTTVLTRFSRFFVKNRTIDLTRGCPVASELKWRLIRGVCVSTSFLSLLNLFFQSRPCFLSLCPVKVSDEAKRNLFFQEPLKSYILLSCECACVSIGGTCGYLQKCAWRKSQGCYPREHRSGRRAPRRGGGERNGLRAFLPLSAMALCGLCYWLCAIALFKRKKRP